MGKNAGQNNSEYRHFLRSVKCLHSEKKPGGSVSNDLVNKFDGACDWIEKESEPYSVPEFTAKKKRIISVVRNLNKAEIREISRRNYYPTPEQHSRELKDVTIYLDFIGS